MRMSPIDQPLMLMELLGRRSPISGSVKVRVGFACDQMLNSWG